MLSDQVFFCGGNAHQVVYDQRRGETVCSKCGLVVEERGIEAESAHLRQYVSWRKRVSVYKAPIGGLHGSNRGVKGHLRRLLEAGCHPLRVQEKAVELFRSVHEMSIVTGYDAWVAANALLYAAYRLSGVPVALSGFAALPQERRRIARCYNKICARLEPNVPKLGYADYLAILTEKAKVDKETEALANRILSMVYENRLLNGANPVGVVAAAFYLASVFRGVRVTQKDVALVAGVSEVTVRVDSRVIRNYSEFQCEL